MHGRSKLLLKAQKKGVTEVKGQNGSAFKTNAKDSAYHMSFKLGFCPNYCSASQHKKPTCNKTSVILGFPVKRRSATATKLSS